MLPVLADAHCRVFIAADCTAAQSVHIVAETGGFLSYLLLWVTVMWGMLLGRGWAMTRFKHSDLYATHMTLALIAMTLGWGHALTQLANPIGTVRFIDEFVPFANGRDPIGIGAGVVGTEIMTALLISMPLQKKLGFARWRMLHSLAYAAFTLIAAHILLSGSEVGPIAVKIPVILLWLSTIAVWLGGVKQRRARAALAAGPGPRDGERTDPRYPDRVDPKVDPQVDPQVDADPAGRAAGEPVVRSARQREQLGEVRVDAAKCTRFGFCEQEAPSVFELREDGRLGYRSTVPGEDLAAVARAVKVCPARAITLTRQSPHGRGRDDGSADGGRSRAALPRGHRYGMMGP